MRWIDETSLFPNVSDSDSNAFNLRTLHAVSEFAGLFQGKWTVETHHLNHPGSEHLQKALDALSGMASRLQKACDARAKVALANKEIDLTSAGITELLPKNLQPLAHVLGVPWEKEIETINSLGMNHLAMFSSKLPLAESAFAAATSKSLKDEVFQEVCQKAEEFSQAFSKKFGNAIDVGADVHQDPLKSFLQKYEQVGPCVESWTLKEVEWVFVKEAEDEMKNDFEKLKKGNRQAEVFSSSLDTIAKHSSSVALIQVLVKLAVSTQSTIKEMTHKTHVLGNTLLFAHLYLSSGPTATVADVAVSEKYSHKYFAGLGVSQLPKTLKEKIEEVKKRVPQPSDKSKDKEKKRRDSEGSKKSTAKKAKK